MYIIWLALGIIFFITCIIISIPTFFKKDKKLNHFEQKAMLFLSCILIGVSMVGLTVYIGVMR